MSQSFLSQNVIKFHCHEKGSGLKSTNLIKRGTKIIVEEPFALSVAYNLRDEICNCCTAVTAGRTKLNHCARCHQRFYCSSVCQKKMWPIHKHECSGLKNLNKVDSSLLSTLLVLTHQVLLKIKVQPDYAKDKKVWRSVDSLVSHYDEIDGKKKEIYYTLCIKTMTLFKKLGFEPPQEFSSCDHIFHLLSRLISNVFTIMNEEMSMELGTGLYLNCSLLNHSCDPNCMQTFVKGAAVIRALRDIQPGEELTITYCPLPARKATRHKDLVEYYFKCSCAVCVDPNIEEQFLLDENGKVIDSDDLEILTEQHEVTLNRMCEEGREMKDALRIGDKFLRESHTHQTNVLRLKVLENMSRAADKIKKFDKMLDCELQLSAIYAKHTPQCAMLGIIYAGVGKLLAYKKQPQEALKFMRKAMEILKNTHETAGHLFGECTRIAVESKMYIQHASAARP